MQADLNTVASHTATKGDTFSGDDIQLHTFVEEMNGPWSGSARPERPLGDEGIGHGQLWWGRCWQHSQPARMARDPNQSRSENFRNTEGAEIKKAKNAIHISIILSKLVHFVYFTVK